MNAYLLHRMAEADRAALVERWMDDPDLHAEIRAAEADLLDAYVRGRLSPEEHTLVERHLLGSRHQYQKLAFAGALHRAFPERAQPGVPRWFLVAAAAMILVLAGTAAWFGLQSRQLRRELAGARPGQAAAPPAAGAVYTTMLPLTSVRSAPPVRRLEVPAGVQAVRLDLELEPGDEAARYVATVSLGDRIVWREEPVQPVDRSGVFVAPVWVPAGVLTPGRFEITLATGGRVIGFYHFTIPDPGPPTARPGR